MNILTVLTKPTDNPHHFEIYWANGVQNQGLLRVRVEQSCDDLDVVAELGALHHLLVVKSIFGSDRAGRSAHRSARLNDTPDPGAEASDRLQLNVTSGQLRKLMQQKSKKLHLVPFALFLSTRFAGSNIVVKNDASWIKPRAYEHVEEIVVSGVLDDHLEVPGIGIASLSAHAIEQVQKRGNGLSLVEAWHQVRKIVRTCDYEYIPSSDKRKRDIDRYGFSGRTFYSTYSGWNVIVTPPSGLNRHLPVIATLYYEKRPTTALVRIHPQAA